jgi:GAF domain-containing protein
VPLSVESRVIGILGAYCVHRDCFGPSDVEFFRLAGELVAIAIENAKTHEASAKRLPQEA